MAAEIKANYPNTRSGISKLLSANITILNAAKDGHRVTQQLTQQPNPFPNNFLQKSQIVYSSREIVELLNHAESINLSIQPELIENALAVLAKS